MSKALLSLCTIVFVQLVTLSFVHSSEKNEKIDEGKKNFLVLHSVYLKWRDGFFGSRTHYRTQLYYMLLEMMGHRIETGYDYVFDTPSMVYQQKLRFAFYGDDWLHIEGKVNKESIKKIIGDDSSLLLSWWRSKKLVSVSGILRDYRIDDWQKKIYVVLENIEVKVKE